MVFWVEKIIWSVYLGKISLCDIRKRTIPVWLLFLGCLLVITDICIMGWKTGIIVEMVPGIILLLLTKMTEAIGRHCIDPVGKYMQRWTGIAYILSEPYLYISVFYDSLYA